MEAFERYLESQKNMIGIRKSAFLTENPKQTVFSIMLETYKQNEDISIRTFSTLSAAISWLGIQNKQSEIENCLNHFINA
jgi:hypothetical protein